jgi:hypothetical protein
MSGTTTIQVTAAEAAVQPTGERKGRRLRRRHLWIIPGLAVAIYANTLGQANGVGILALIAFGIAPDVPRLFGARGRPMHNVLHQPLAAAAAVAIAGAATVAGVPVAFWLVGALVWLGHLIVGWGVGDVPRPGGVTVPARVTGGAGDPADA